MKKLICLLALLVLCGAILAGCGDAEPQQPAPAEETAAQSAGADLADGVYSAVFDTDSTMFYLNEANEGRGVLTVENGQMTIHISLAGKGIVNLYPGTAEDAQKEGAVLLQPTEDTVRYADGTSDTVYGFDVPVPALDQEFPCAIVGRKGNWYDHMVTVSDPQPLEEAAAG